MEIFAGKTADEVWCAAAEGFGDGRCRVQESRLGPTLEISQAVFVIKNPRLRWIHSRNPPANIALALAQVIWIMNARSDTKFLSAWSKSYSQYVGNVPLQRDAYGNRLRRHFGIDQLRRASMALANNSQTRQVVLQLWDGTVDLPSADGSPADPNVPCNVLSMLKVREGSLEWTQVLRSNDFYRGSPYNFFQFTTLQELIAGWIGVVPGTYTHISDSLHVYGDELRPPLQTLGSDLTFENTDSLAFDMEECFRHFEGLEQAVEELSLATLDPDVIAIGKRSFPEPLANFMWIFIAERLRQLRMASEARDIVHKCTNPYLMNAWTRWFDHLDRKSTL